MATRSRIGIELKDGSILSAYHHWDGYPQWLGRILNTHYTSRDKVAELIDGGDMSSCWTNERWDAKPNKFGGHESNKDGTEYGAQYYSQRGDDCPPRLDPTLAAYANKDRGEEYHYVYRKVAGEYTWVCIDMNTFNDEDPQTVSIPTGALAV